VPWERDYSLPIDALLEAKADAIYLANPNAPTGTFVSPMKVEELAKQFKGLVLIDEAYVDFAEDDCVPLVREYANVVISRTMSKAYSLAGLRFGYAVGQPPVIAEMMKVKDSYNTDAISVIAATAAIQDQTYAERSWDHRPSGTPAIIERIDANGLAGHPQPSQLHPRRLPERRRQGRVPRAQAAGHFGPTFR
jgi:histidinol-phosphate/aromatic aminotransferase/cobyric acid decarboxylase-like protein